MKRSRCSTIAYVLLVWQFETTAAKPEPVDTVSLNHIANVSYSAEHEKLSALASIFSPRMDFDQWKPLTGRGDPLRNDPTYDYEPPLLERVHYWAEDTRLEREHYPERKSEVLMLGVSSRRPSAAPRPPPSRRNPRPPHQSKYEDYSYKNNDHYPMAILVPPPLPPPGGYKPSLYVLHENKMPSPHTQIRITDPPTFAPKATTTPMPEHLSSLYALQESNLIYQSSTTSQNWVQNLNQTKTIPNVSNDYAGWGPTTPLDENDAINETYNLISYNHNELPKHTYTFYKPMLSKAPPPPLNASSSVFLPTFIPTALPPTATPQITTFISSTTTQTSLDATTTEIPTAAYYDETTTERLNPHKYKTTPGFFSGSKTEKNIFDMLGPMLSMPLANGPDRPEDNLYAHASENVHVYKEQSTEDSVKLETMQTMQPPPPVQITDSTTTLEPYHTNPHFVNSLIRMKPSQYTQDPYLHMRFTTTTPTTVQHYEDIKPTTDATAIPYLIIQGHSKVKTYSSKPDIKNDHDPISNEIPKLNETDEVKHLHPIKENKPQKVLKTKNQSRSKSLQSLVDYSFGSIEIQETDIGIKYDVSDGSDVPVEIYRKGIVDGGENTYVSKKLRTKRQLDLDDLLPFDEDTIEEYVYNFINGKRNSTGITGLIAQAVTSDAASVVDELEEEEDDEPEDER